MFAIFFFFFFFQAEDGIRDADVTGVQTCALPIYAVTPVADRAALRHTTRDHLPITGWLTPSLGVIGGLSSRGFTSAPICAELLVSQWLQEPLPLTAELAQRLAPQRLQGVVTVPECEPYR